MSGSGGQRPVPASVHVPEDAIIVDADNNNGSQVISSEISF